MWEPDPERGWEDGAQDGAGLETSDDVGRSVSDPARGATDDGASEPGPGGSEFSPNASELHPPASDPGSCESDASLPEPGAADPAEYGVAAVEQAGEEVELSGLGEWGTRNGPWACPTKQPGGAEEDPWETDASAEAGAGEESEDPFLVWEPEQGAAAGEADPMMDTLLAGLLEQWEQEGQTQDAEQEEQQAVAGPPVPEASELISRLGAELAEAAPRARTMPTPVSLSERSATRRESVLRLLAAMYPEAASRLTGQSGAAQTPVQALRRAAGDGYVVFQLGGESFALPVRQVLEADRVPPYTPAPFVPEFVRGVTNRRGDVLPLIDLRLLLGVEPGPRAGDGRMLVVRRNESDSPAALLVDSLGGIAWFDRLLGVRLTSHIAGRFPELLRGAGLHRDATVHVLDLDRLFARKELEELTAA
jgi:purine-binding chemotaxis protein CheW